MRHVMSWSGLALLLWAGVAHAGSPEFRLRGDFAFTGEAACLASTAGFNANLTPIGVSFGQSFSIAGVETFNGDGTGTSTGHNITVTVPAGTPNASSADFSSAFTYEVAPDGTITTTLSGLVTGTVLTGTRAGQTFTVDTPPATGRIAAGGKSLTLTTAEPPTVETVTYSNGDVHYRICYRSRVLLRVAK